MEIAAGVQKGIVKYEFNSEMGGFDEGYKDDYKKSAYTNIDVWKLNVSMSWMVE